MRTIALTHGCFAVVDDEDYESLVRHAWYAHKGGRSERRYAARSVRIDGKKKTLMMHRVILNDFTSPQIDHKDGNSLNNTRQNLRPCTAHFNAGNRPGWGRSSKYKGVCFDKITGRWASYIRVNGNQIHLGRFVSEEDAARAYDAAALDTFGEFARLNFPALAA